MEVNPKCCDYCKLITFCQNSSGGYDCHGAEKESVSIDHKTIWHCWDVKQNKIVTPKKNPSGADNSDYCYEEIPQRRHRKRQTLQQIKKLYLWQLSESSISTKKQSLGRKAQEEVETMKESPFHPVCRFCILMFTTDTSKLDFPLQTRATLVPIWHHSGSSSFVGNWRQQGEGINKKLCFAYSHSNKILFSLCVIMGSCHVFSQGTY